MGITHLVSLVKVMHPLTPRATTTLRFAAFALGVASATAQAVPIAIANHGFEQPAIAAGTFATNAPPPGWSGYGALNFGARTIGVLHPATTTLYTVPPPEGAQVGVVFLMDNPANQLQFANSEAGLQQVLGAVLQTNRRYVLTVAIGNIGNDVAAPFLFGGFPGYRVALQAGGVTIGVDSGAVLPPEAGFLTTTLVVDVPAVHPQAGLPLRIRLGNRNAAPGIEVNFDDVRLTVEPTATWTDLGQGLAGAGGIPSLVGTGSMLGGSTNNLAVAGAPGGGLGVLVIGLAAVNQPLFGGTLVPAPELLFLLVANGSGATSFPFALATPPPSGTELFAQYWAFDASVPTGFAVSNAVRASVP